MAAMLVTLIVCVCLLPFYAMAQTTHVVGGNMGWVIPTGDAGAYTTWAATRTFIVGDKLLFNYAAGQHDVAQSSKAAYDACNASLPIISTTMAAPATITLTMAGENYFFCTIGRHCALGQKLSINVSSAASSPSPAPVPNTASPTPPPSRKVGAPVPSADSPSPVTAPAPTSGVIPPSTPNLSSPSPAGSNPSPNPGNYASSTSVSGLSAVVLSLIVAYMLH